MNFEARLDLSIIPYRLTLNTLFCSDSTLGKIEAFCKIPVKAMSKLILEIPEDLAEALRVPPEERLSRVRQELAVRLYQKGLLSFGKARKLAQMSK